MLQSKYRKILFRHNFLFAVAATRVLKKKLFSLLFVIEQTNGLAMANNKNSNRFSSSSNENYIVMNF